ncbi:hypothetical protein GJU03_01380 [Enterobacteriaceae endosymbiont of Donacia bicoloricornis]|uniref:hypothetical protein n=1 Tax=Enterobacteriaceae endosymbiont of Donacia bicoloricornis TaxID=2675772 RepID=UPI0014494630|nr:hypothetical protein [Enterobacteriaceae endosymbiont of Donacia bicoloricornis]QJC37799.1 hypothetical protein GJU03_01380 [Enterobacteriaceae endosymbiont of Donacia bicoloricornis]
MITIICFYKHLIEIILFIFLLRLWIYFSINDYYNSFVRYIMLLTNFILKYFKIFFLKKKKNELLLILVIIILLLFLKYPILILIQDKNLFFYKLNAYLFVSILTLLKFLGYLFFWLITIYLISNIFNFKNNDLIDLLEIFINQIYNFKKNNFFNTYNINIILLITNIILYFLSNLLIDLFPQFWFLI